MKGESRSAFLADGAPGGFIDLCTTLLGQARKETQSPPQLGHPRECLRGQSFAICAAVGADVAALLLRGGLAGCFPRRRGGALPCRPSRLSRRRLLPPVGCFALRRARLLLLLLSGRMGRCFFTVGSIMSSRSFQTSKPAISVNEAPFAPPRRCSAQPVATQALLSRAYRRSPPFQRGMRG